ncbi:hypothetical protein C7999DRAFT_42561 [Corynascus novoguineensis]|uniref:AB hydrolase-1 domain-containing protein n=1 Tax=Corynascus novoguineensis TaxID=1126955 RepID=A0AAN7CQF9_9PEZI|nr:hypothetical protein C7999DRAFT_42561 [Corynascus novoguineensis]
MSINWNEIKAAKRIGISESSGQDGLKALSMRFEVPLVHSNPAGSTRIILHAVLIYRASQILSGIPARSRPETILMSMLPPSKTTLCVYLCGGPGDDNPAFKNLALTRELLGRFGPVLYLDYRGTGRSSAIRKSTLVAKTPEQMAWYMTQFRQDSIVADLEAIRKSFNGIKFVPVAQSFGGWIAMTYLSYLPKSLSEVWLFGGMPPIGKTPDDVYKALYQRLVGVNQEYYGRYPEDKTAVMRIVERLSRADNGRGILVSTETGERLTARGFLTLGRHLGAEDGFDTVHSLVEKFGRDLDTGGVSSRTIQSFQKRKGTGFRLPQRPLYGAFHEAIYCFGPGVASNWAAQRVGRHQAGGNFAWLEGNFQFKFPSPDKIEPLCFSAEMIYEFMLRDAGPELKPFIKAAEILAEKNDWSSLYDSEALRRNKVLVRALMYPRDLYVDFELSKNAAATVGNCRAISAPEHWLHGSVKKNPTAVFEFLSQV